VSTAVLAERDDEEFGTVENAFDLEREELVAAFAERSGGEPAFFVH